MSLILLLLACADKTEPGGDGTADGADGVDGADGGGDSGGAGWDCLLEPEPPPEYAQALGCEEDFLLLATNPYDASIPGAWSTKTVLDRLDNDALYFQNTALYPLHWNFASTHLSGDGLPYVGDQSSFNATEYYSPDRRFILGALTWYEEPDLWVYEISPYDTADAAMVELAFRSIRASTWVGERLAFHPTSESIELVAAELPEDIPILSTEELYAGITYQPLNLGTAMGQLRFAEAATLDVAYVNYREIVVLDEIPIDISVVAGIITDEFQTPLSHINVLSQNRGTPNMALDGAWESEELRALDGAWVELTVGAFEWTVREVSQEEADAWWEANRPDPLTPSPMNLEITALTDAEDILDDELYDLHSAELGLALDEAIPAFGGKAGNFGGMAHIGPPLVIPDAFAIPVYWYWKHMEDNGLWAVMEAMEEDPAFTGDPATRAAMLEDFQRQIEEAPLDPDFYAALLDKMRRDYPGQRMKMRSSTTAEDLGSFTGAGLYQSRAADPDDPEDPIDVALKEVWSSVWGPRAWEEREYWGIDHMLVGMGVLCHPSFTDEEANGVAITNNIFDTSGLEPALYINAQLGEASVVEPESGVTTDQILYFYDLPGQPVVYLAHSNLVAEGETVLSSAELYELGSQLDAIHDFFYPAYGGSGWYAMDTEWKVERDIDGSHVTVKQARPYPGRGE